MREIKFRAWDKDIGVNGSLTHHEVCKHDGSFFNLYTTDLLMQYTGFNDKNGKEIYEGDIIRIVKNWEYEVIWADNSASFCLKSIKRKPTKNKGRVFVYQGLRKAQKGNVIGNIYENPDLLK